MSVATKRKLAKQTLATTDQQLVVWQEAFGRGDLVPRDCAPMIDALLDLRTVASEWAEAPAKVTA